MPVANTFSRIILSLLAILILPGVIIARQVTNHAGSEGNNKYVYTGNLENSKPHGFGIMRFTDGPAKGDVYSGNFRKGKRHGIGRLDRADGSVAFGRWENGNLKTPPKQNFTPGNRVYGIDISKYQTNIDWDNIAIPCDRNGFVKNGNAADIKSGKYLQPVSFVYVRAEHGVKWPDNMYAAHFKQAKAHGIPVGSYHFMHFETENAAEQAEFFLRRTNNCLNDDLPPMLDIEEHGDYAINLEKKSPGAIQRMTEKWLKAVEKATGRKPILYFNPNFAKYLNLRRLRDYKLWISKYNPSDEPDIHPWFIWQFTDKGRINGYTREIDIDFWDGNIAHFRRHMLTPLNPR